MSALPPKADVFGIKINVCFVPLADIQQTFAPKLFCHEVASWKFDRRAENMVFSHDHTI